MHIIFIIYLSSLNHLYSQFLNFEMDSSKNFNFSTKQYKEQHISIVHGEVKIFECNVCSKTFAQNHELTIHIEPNHKQQRNHKCDSCGKYFTQSGNLNNHIRTIHEKQSIYKCDYCGKSSTRSVHLKNHIKTIHD